MYAIISDLHSNIEALTAVAEDMQQFSVERIYCLGDVIGYGPSPVEVMRLIRSWHEANPSKCPVLLFGNHEEGLLEDSKAADFNPRARRALSWTRDQINSSPRDERNAFWDLLDTMSRSPTAEGDGAMFVHGSLRNETRDYVLPADIHDRRKMNEIFTKMHKNVCFFGHTHIPGIWTESGRFQRPEQFNGSVVVPAEKVVINVGSVGQPRDGDNRACYALVDGDRVTFRRVKYDFESTMRKIFEIDELDDMLAERLRVGR